MRQHSQLREIAKRISTVVSKIDRKAADSAATGYLETLSGVYWPRQDAETLLELRREAISVASGHEERFASSYAYGALLWQLLELDAAADVCRELINMDASRCDVAWNMLAFIEARKGHLDEARKYAALIAEKFQGSSFSVIEEDILSEFAKSNSQSS